VEVEVGADGHASAPPSGAAAAAPPAGAGKYLLFMAHSSDDDIPLVWHQMSEVHRTTTLQELLETPQWHKFAKTQAYIDFKHAHPARIHESQ
jgi:hypothetical protein